MSMLAEHEQFRFWDPRDEETAKKLEEEEKKKKTGIPDWKIPEPEPFERIFVPRKDWNAGPHAEGHEYLDKPIMWVRFWKYTDTQECLDKEMCKKMVQEIQARHKEKGFGDITHNFLVGSDGNVYEGRGWDYKAPRDTRYKHDKKSYIDVAFIGDERNKKYDNQVIYRSVFRLLDFGRKMTLISPEVQWTWEE